MIPFMNTERPSVMAMRGEIVSVLGALSVTLKDLVYFGDVFSRASSGLDLALVDHNELSGRWRKRYPGIRSLNVLSILDHHQDARQFLDARPRTITACGSTATLLTLQVVEEGDPIRLQRLDHISGALLKTIVFDTVNLTWRQTELDRQAVALLSNRGQVDTRLLMDALEDAIDATPESNFGIFDLLGKDFKLYSYGATDNNVIYYGISTLHISFEDMFSSQPLPVWEAEVRRFMEEEDLVVLLMTNAMREKGASTHRQQLAICTQNPAMHRELVDIFDGRQLGLLEIHSSSTLSLHDQTNITISRKQLHPILKEYLASCTHLETP